MARPGAASQPGCMRSTLPYTARCECIGMMVSLRVYVLSISVSGEAFCVSAEPAMFASSYHERLLCHGPHHALHAERMRRLSR
jgi:hypothetical protein